MLHFFRVLGQQGQTYAGFTPNQLLTLIEYLRTVPSRRQAQRLGVALCLTADGQPALGLSAVTINRTLAASAPSGAPSG